MLVAADAQEEGRGGVSKVARSAGISRETVYQDLRELAAGTEIAPGASANRTAAANALRRGSRACWQR